MIKELTKTRLRRQILLQRFVYQPPARIIYHDPKVTCSESRQLRPIVPSRTDDVEAEAVLGLEDANTYRESDRQVVAPENNENGISFSIIVKNKRYTNKKRTHGACADGIPRYCLIMLELGFS